MPLHALPQRCLHYVPQLTQRCSFCHSPQPLILLCPLPLPSPPLACNSYCVNSSLRCRFPSSPSFLLFFSSSFSSPCEVLPARATRDTPVIMAVPVLDQMGELFDIISNRFPLPPCVPFMLEAVQKTNIQQVCSVFSFELNFKLITHLRHFSCNN